VGVHHFKKVHFDRPTWCEFCSRFIWGLGKQGYACTKCSFAAHSKCKDSVPLESCRTGVAATAQLDNNKRRTLMRKMNSKQSTRFLTTQPNRVYVHVIGGRDLAIKDKTGYSDPYCIVNLVNQKRKTNTLMQTLFPRWNQLLTFGVPDSLEGQSLFLICMDFDQVGSDDFMGEFNVDLSKLTLENPFMEGWYKLEPRAEKDDEVSGDIHLQIEFVLGDGDPKIIKPLAPSSEPVISGILQCQTKEGWKPRYCEVDSHSFRYFSKAEKDGSPPRQQIELVEIQNIRTKPKDDIEHGIMELCTTINSETVFAFSHESPTELWEWLLTLSGLLDDNEMSLRSLNDTARAEVLAAMHLTPYKGGVVKSSYEEEWQYFPDGRLICVMGTDAAIKLRFRWNGSTLTQESTDSEDNSLILGIGDYNGHRLNWYVPDDSDPWISLKWDRSLREYSDGVMNWKWTRHFLANKNGDGEWILEGGVPEPVVMFLQIIYQARQRLALPTSV